jgi:glyoxylase-like metal-dependent hydrolase (beta-lactamase superfamily II)
MSGIDRRDFVKSLSVAAGTVALAGTPLAMAQPAGGNKSAAGKTMYEVFALKYAGPFDRKLAMMLFATGWAEDISIYYYIWAIRNKATGETTLVDTGTGHTWPKENNVKTFVPPEQMVARLGVKPEQVTRVVVTHMHFDHIGGMENMAFAKSYPQAKFYVQKKEFDFFVNSPLALRAPYKALQWLPGTQGLADLGKTPRLEIVNGDKVIGPDMQLLLTPGHTPGLQGVCIPTAKGTTVVGSDVAHLFRSFKEDRPSGLITDMPIWLESYDKLRAVAPIENLFPGHDAMMLNNFPKVAEDITQLA